MYQYTKETLPNGLRVIYVEMPHIHSVVLAAYIGMGSRYESEDRMGLSHFVEHMLFRGARGFKDSFELLQALDNVGGDLDAYTSPEYSALLVQVHSKHWEKGLRILSDIILGGNFRAEAVETERRIIKEEIGHFLDVKGDYVCIDDLSYNLMWRGDSLSAASIGSEEIINSFKIEDIAAHYRKHFVPENIVLCVSGNIEKALKERSGDVLLTQPFNIIQELFGGFSGKLTIEKPVSQSRQEAPRHFFKKSPAPLICFKLCHKAYPYKHPDVIIMQLIADVLGGGISSRLLFNVREKLGLVYDIGANPTLFSDVGSIDILTSTKPANFEKTVAAVTKEVNSLVEHGITPEELRRTEERVFTQTQFVMDSPLLMANWFGVEELLISPQNPDTPEEQAQKVREVKPERISQVIADIFIPQKRNLVVVGPFDLRKKRKVIALIS
ncbi:MAG: M16 family metallopeptidase [Candidatus Brocadiales bacterium]